MPIVFLPFFFKSILVYCTKHLYFQISVCFSLNAVDFTHVRTLDMTHALVKQTKERQKQSFGIVKERITNAQPCSVVEEVQQSGQCGGGLSLCGPQNSKVP